jgi:hypothetical protein
MAVLSWPEEFDHAHVNETSSTALGMISDLRGRSLMVRLQTANSLLSIFRKATAGCVRVQGHFLFLAR